MAAVTATPGTAHVPRDFCRSFCWAPKYPPIEVVSPQGGYLDSRRRSFRCRRAIIVERDETPARDASAGEVAGGIAGVAVAGAGQSGLAAVAVAAPLIVLPILAVATARWPRPGEATRFCLPCAAGVSADPRCIRFRVRVRRVLRIAEDQARRHEGCGTFAHRRGMPLFPVQGLGSRSLSGPGMQPAASEGRRGAQDSARADPCVTSPGADRHALRHAAAEIGPTSRIGCGSIERAVAWPGAILSGWGSPRSPASSSWRSRRARCST